MSSAEPGQNPQSSESDDIPLIPRLVERFNNLDLQPKIGSGFAVPCVFFFLVAVSGLISFTRSQRATAAVQNTSDRIARANHLSQLIVDMETGERGFLIAGRDEFLEPFDLAAAAWDAEVRTLAALVVDDSVQSARVTQIDSLASAWHRDAAGPEIATRRRVRGSSRGLEFMQAELRRGTGKGLLDEMRGNLSALEGRFRASGNQRGLTLVMRLAKAMVDQETGQRGFLITGEDAFLAPFYEGLQAFPEGLTALRTLTRNSFDGVATLEQIDSVEQMLAEWLKWQRDQRSRPVG